MAFGTLLNIVAAMDAGGLPVSWAEQATGPVPAALYEGVPVETPADSGGI
jgi:hypothetical protein